jgi:outer membrane protein assembly factor BamB
MNKTVTALICLIIIYTAALVTPLTAAEADQQLNPTYNGSVASNDEVNAETMVKYSVNNGSDFYVDQKDFSIKFNAYLNSPEDLMSLGSFLFNVTYKASWLNESVTVYRWSFHDPSNLKDDDPNPQASIQATVPLKDAPRGQQHIDVTVCGGGYLLSTLSDGSFYQTYFKNSTTSLSFTINGASPVTPTPSFNDESGILWETNIPWSLQGTPAQNYWQTEISSKQRSWTPPVVVDDTVYAGVKSTVSLNQYGNPEVDWIDIYAFNRQNGEVIWDYRGNYSTFQISNLAVSNGVIYFGADDHVTALNASTSKELWKTACTTFYSNPTVAQGKVFMGSGESVIALDTAEGKLVWNFSTADTVVSSPTVANGVVFVGSNDGNLYALNAENGAEIWSFKAGEGFRGTAAVVDGVVYAGSGDGFMYALRAVDGSKVWSYDTSSPKVEAPEGTDQTFDPSSPVVADDVLVFTSSGLPYDASAGDYSENWVGTVYGFSTMSGQMIWSTPVDDACGSPVVSGGIVFVNVYPYKLMAFRVNDGVNVWNYSNVETDPVVVDGVTFFASNGELYALTAPIGDSNGLPINLQYSINYPWLAALSALIISVTILVIYNFQKPLLPLLRKRKENKTATPTTSTKQ